MATLIIPPVLTSPRDDAAQLYKAFKGFGCDTAPLINILAHRDATQRGLIQQEYKVMYSEDLSNRLSRELSGDNKKAFLLWMHDPAVRDATIVRQALSSVVVDLRAATEVICSRTPSQIQYFKQIYYTMNGVYLEHDIESRTSDDHKKLLLSYVRTIRYEGPEVDSVLAERDAKALYKAGEKRWGTDEKTFIRIFTESSSAHLASVSYAYKNKYKNKLRSAVKSETSGLFRFGLLSILRCAKNPASFFAKQLHKAMKGLGTNDAALIRIIVTRVEIDMQYIKAEYRKKYKKCLNDAVYSETSGNYRTFLLSLLGPNY
ncbi:annexin D5-like [Solanum tuberosum]|uniref:annexin D5-like n=1 Tax=Solanum tuberosum TaxID=4113 RepID=UPI0003D2729F|nr:PREDICTED: annexin D5-like [Solanum tuberosum]